MFDGIAMVHQYLAAMEACNLEATLACFTEEATVISPVYGEVAILPFYEKLFSDTIAVSLDIQAIYVAEGHPNRLIAHFGYHWERTGQPTMDTHLVDFFEIDARQGKIRRLRIVFDDAVTKSDPHR